MRTLAWLSLLVTCGCGSRTGLGIDLPGPDATTPDASTDTSLSDAGPSSPSPLCTLREANANISGMTPLGFVSFPFSWAGYLEGCGATLLRLSSERRLLTDAFGNVHPAEPSLSVGVMASPDWHEGELENTAELRVDGETVMGTARVEISAYDWPGDDPRSRSPTSDGWCRCLEEELDDCGPRPNVRTLEVTLEMLGDQWALTGELTPRQCHVFHGICL